MSDPRQAMQMALTALENCASEHGHRCNRCDSEVDEGHKVIAALRAALSAQEEPIGFVSWHTSCPPQFSETFAGVYRDTATRIEAVYTHPAPTGQPSQSAWVRAVDEAMVTHHVGVADASDDYEAARRKLNNLLDHVQSIGEYFARQQLQPLTDEQLLVIARQEAVGYNIKLARDDGPYEVTQITHVYRQIARAIERAHGIGGPDAS